jgi:DNA-binding winged helix-turn-helix (wHTH) protein
MDQGSMTGPLQLLTDSKRVRMNPLALLWKELVVTIPTVFMVGVERLPLVPEYLNLGSVVVVAPDQNTLRRWVWEQAEGGPPAADDGREPGTVVDLEGRRIISDGATLPLSDLEYRVLSALLSPTGRALSFRELRSSGWGDAPEIPADIYSVRALVQRLRAKLHVADADITIQAIRGFGFRAATVPNERFGTDEERREA